MNTSNAKAKRSTAPAGRLARRHRSRWPLIAIGVAVVAVVVTLFVIYQGSPNRQTSASGGSYQHVAGQPGIGATAPDFTLDSTSGGQLGLASLRGKTVLLYFQEGLSCQPCWDQLADLEHHRAALQQSGVDAVVSITTDPIDLLRQKVGDAKLSTPVLSDPTLVVSQAYHANEYGMMGTSRDGHSFVLVGPDGRIQWRADYGGAPNYTMFLPTTSLLADLTRERRTA